MVEEGALPKVFDSARGLGVREGTDIHPVGGFVSPEWVGGRAVGLSVAPISPLNLHPNFRPKTIGGNGKDPVWAIDSRQLGPMLFFDQDTPTHGTIAPAYRMTTSAYKEALAFTRPLWLKVINGN
jgi:hypothetical protein